MKVRLAVLTVALTSIGCAQDSQVTGQVFIVTQGRENVRMGAIEVPAIPEEELKGFSEAQSKAASAESERLNAEIDWCFTEMERGSSMNPASAEFQELSDRVTKRCEIGETIDDSKMGKNAARMAVIATGETAFAALPKPQGASSSKTDADGRFSLALKRGRRYALAATAQRSVPGRKDPEKYFWLMWVTPEAEKAQVILSNDNLMSAANSNGVVTLPRPRATTE